MKRFWFVFFIFVWGCYREADSEELYPLETINEALLQVEDLELTLLSNIYLNIQGSLGYAGDGMHAFWVGSQMKYENATLYFGVINLAEQIEMDKALSNPAFSGAFLHKIRFLAKENLFNIDLTMFDDIKIEEVKELVWIFYLYEANALHIPSDDRERYFRMLKRAPRQRIELRIQDFKLVDSR